MILGIVLFTATYFIFYPPTYAIIDEAGYLSTAYMFSHTKIFYDQLGMEKVATGINTGEHYISKYPPGNALLLLPFTLINWRWVFLRGYILMIIGLWVFIKLLREFHLPSFYGLLFLFHPSLLIYSRTLMSDVPATVCTLIAVYLFIKNKYLWSGLILGFGVWIRYPSLALGIVFCAILLLKKDFGAFKNLLLGFIIMLIPLLFYNLLIFENLLGPFAITGTGFGCDCFGKMLLNYVISLNVLYPFLLIAALFSCIKKKWYFVLPSLVFVIGYSCQCFIDTGNNFFESVIRGQRYMLPIVPLLLIPYIHTLNRKSFVKVLIKPAIILLFISSIFSQFKHNRYLHQLMDYQGLVYHYLEDADCVYCNKDIYELINPYLGYIPWQPIDSLKSARLNGRNIYLACLARDEDSKEKFLFITNQIPEKKKIYEIQKPVFFSIWRIEFQKNDSKNRSLDFQL